jgi:hypothetical protein
MNSAGFTNPPRPLKSPHRIPVIVDGRQLQPIVFRQEPPVRGMGLRLLPRKPDIVRLYCNAESCAYLQVDVDELFASFQCFSKSGGGEVLFRWSAIL